MCNNPFIIWQHKYYFIISLYYIKRLFVNISTDHCINTRSKWFERISVKNCIFLQRSLHTCTASTLFIRSSIIPSFSNLKPPLTTSISPRSKKKREKIPKVDDLTKGRIFVKIHFSLEKNTNPNWKIEIGNVISIFTSYNLK